MGTTFSISLYLPSTPIAPASNYCTRSTVSARRTLILTSTRDPRPLMIDIRRSLASSPAALFRTAKRTCCRPSATLVHFVSIPSCSCYSSRWRRGCSYYFLRTITCSVSLMVNLLIRRTALTRIPPCLTFEFVSPTAVMPAARFILFHCILGKATTRHY